MFKAEGDFEGELDGEERRSSIPPEEIIERMDLNPKHTFLDLGAGIGYFSFPISAKVSSVIAIDSQSEMVAALMRRMRLRCRGNIVPMLGDVLSLPLADESVDSAMMAFVYHEVTLPTVLLSECSRVLRPKGKLTIVEFQKCETDFGPPVKDRKPPEHVERRAKKHFKPLSHFSEEVYYQMEFEKR